MEILARQEVELVLTSMAMEGPAGMKTGYITDITSMTAPLNRAGNCEALRVAVKGQANLRWHVPVQHVNNRQ